MLVWFGWPKVEEWGLVDLPQVFVLMYWFDRDGSWLSLMSGSVAAAQIRRAFRLFLFFLVWRRQRVEVQFGRNVLWALPWGSDSDGATAWVPHRMLQRSRGQLTLVPLRLIRWRWYQITLRSVWTQYCKPTLLKRIPTINPGYKES